MIHRELGGATAWFTDRHGGISTGPFLSCNLARHVGDDAAAVAANRQRVTAAIGRPGARWMQPHHVHGTTVVAMTDPAAHDAYDDRDADGTATTRADAVLVAIGADCAPVAIANDTAWAAVHAGWRGAADGVVQAGVAAVRALGRGPVRVVVGPCICAAHYEFGAADLARPRATARPGGRRAHGVGRARVRPAGGDRGGLRRGRRRERRGPRRLHGRVGGPLLVSTRRYDRPPRCGGVLPVSIADRASRR